MWPEIQAGLATGKKLKQVWEAARQDGLHISYPHFRVYVSRLRRREQTQKVQRPQRDQQLQSAAPPHDGTAEHREVPIDPLYNVRVQLEKKRQSHFEYNPFPDPKDTIT